MFSRGCPRAFPCNRNGQTPGPVTAYLLSATVVCDQDKTFPSLNRRVFNSILANPDLNLDCQRGRTAEVGWREACRGAEGSSLAGMTSPPGWVAPSHEGPYVQKEMFSSICLAMTVRPAQPGIESWTRPSLFCRMSRFDFKITEN